MTGHRAAIGVVALTIAASIACAESAALTQLVEARRLAAELRVQFTKAAEAASRAVMAASDPAASNAATESRRASEAVAADIESLKGLLEKLEYPQELELLQAFAASFEEYRRIDAELLPLAIENTNVKAQALSFGASREAARVFQAALAAAAKHPIAASSCGTDLAVARARAAVLEIQALQAPHIAEADDAAMSQMEGEMKASEDQARQQLESLKPLLTPARARPLAEASAALERFVTINRELVGLSRRNSNVRSLAIALGRKRTVTAAGEEHLQALEQTLARHEFRATR